MKPLHSASGFAESFISAASFLLIRGEPACAGLRREIPGTVKRLHSASGFAESFISAASFLLIRGESARAGLRREIPGPVKRQNIIRLRTRAPWGSQRGAHPFILCGGSKGGGTQSKVSLPPWRRFCLLPCRGDYAKFYCKFSSVKHKQLIYGNI